MLAIIHYVFITEKEKYEQHKNSFDEHFMLTLNYIGSIF